MPRSMEMHKQKWSSIKGKSTYQTDQMCPLFPQPSVRDREERELKKKKKKKGQNKSNNKKINYLMNSIRHLESYCS